MTSNSYHTLAKEIAKALQIIHSDDKKKGGAIKSLKSYNDKGILSYAYLRKLVDMDIIVQRGTSKKSSRYEWNHMDDPDYYELALTVIDFSPTRNPVVVRERKELPIDNNKIKTIIRLTLRLNEKGYTPEEILEEVPKLLEIAST